MERSQLKGKAKAQLKGNWLLAILAILVASIIMSIVISVVNLCIEGGLLSSEGSLIITIIGFIITFVIIGVMCLGICQFTLNMVGEDKEASFSDIFAGFSVFLKTAGLSILLGIALFIGYMIFVIPGIILSLMFSQCLYIMADDRNIGIIDCIKKSCEMMKGHKWEYFVLGLSFIGWAILASIVCGLGYLWLMPYQQVTFANYYLELKNQPAKE